MRENLENLKEYALVTDSASDISKEFAKKYNINVVPIYIHYNGKEFKDGVDIDSNRIYTFQKEKKAIFTSSSPSPHDFAQVYEKLLKEYKKIFSIHISSKLSAVIKSARIARGLIKAEKRIKIFDSLSGAMGTGFMVLTAARSILKKYSCDKILFLLNFLRDNIKMYGTIDTLKYLQRSGRVPAIASLMSGILKIKPILGIKNGIVEMIGIAVTRRGSLAEIARRVIKDFKKERWVIVSIIHTLSFMESKRIMKKIQSSLNCVDTMITECTPVIGAHTGPGLVGVIVSKLNSDIADLFI
ncbi:DegV domain-containing protein [subsurface metagenome]|nr:DegV family EDD domain-containing protein [Clostridia bacterium]